MCTLINKALVTTAVSAAFFAAIVNPASAETTFERKFLETVLVDYCTADVVSAEGTAVVRYRYLERDGLLTVTETINTHFKGRSGSVEYVLNSTSRSVVRVAATTVRIQELQITKGGTPDAVFRVVRKDPEGLATFTWICRGGGKPVILEQVVS